MLNDNLYRLYEELETVQNAVEEFLPGYGYSSKIEIIELIKADIEELEGGRGELQFDYTSEELEAERTDLCQSQGIARYC